MTRERSILVVDDEESVREPLAAILRREGYTVHTAESAADGLALMRAQPIQLVITDYKMPEMTGVEFLKLVRERFPNALRIMLTADQRELIEQAAKAGGLDMTAWARPILLQTAQDQLAEAGQKKGRKK